MYDYLFAPPGSYEYNDYDFDYVLTISSDNLADFDQSNSDLDSQTNPQMVLKPNEHDNENEEDIDNTSYDKSGSEEPIIEHHDTPLTINLDLSDVEETPNSQKDASQDRETSHCRGKEANIVLEDQYPMWLANIVTVKKKNGQIRVFVNFKDLNKACPKDEFAQLIPELTVDIASTQIFSFMDGSSGYNQIKMAPEDATLTAFKTLIEIFYYIVMSFGLKNVKETYQ
ncbi:uncharacterized protein LOC110035627 [Phalaenopsis equestris]|uniref:uncharacterized protein LOC110035627 n=1 Tax=Phalaenopsis equestris TaxID=78828 RepID=UPI0009E29EE5|nr:uncharacterized protein LOC110035627 [Phalaenopsis equestris]